MSQLNNDRLNAFARAILLELHRLQKRSDSQTKQLVC